ncbi:DUF2334 domain-containing protein [Sphingomonas segetis]|jgi:predicted deacetylase|uniref:DUF2334 domain-containing protein n=1 Tax=Sphingomonas segetis TaxID=1104779 RepID=UPI0018AD44BA|nr:DUF2334 domain-containing protein [Sphingomonas segetis]
MLPTRERLLLASIHDVSPRFETEVDRLLDLLRPYVGGRVAMLVVPNHWGDAPIVPGSPFAARLRRWADAGTEIFLHGYFHRDESQYRLAANRVRARFMTAAEGEFLGLSREEASARITGGRALLEDVIGRPIDGFVAPAWLYGEGTMAALAQARIAIAEDHLRIWSPASGADLARGPVITWASRTRLRLGSSLLAAAALRRAPIAALRIGVHPPDCRHSALVRSIGKTFATATRTRRPARYSDLLAKSASRT